MSWSWGVAKKISKLPSWRGLQKNHAQLRFYKGFPCKLKIEWVCVWLNFKITLVRGYPTWAPVRTNQANHRSKVIEKQASHANPSYERQRWGKFELRQQTNKRTKKTIKANSSNLSKQSKYRSHPATQPASQPISQPISQPTNQPTKQLTNQPTKQLTNQPTSQ